jgi:hypothetical protein
MSKKSMIVLIYHRHELLSLIYNWGVCLHLQKKGLIRPGNDFKCSQQIIVSLYQGKPTKFRDVGRLFYFVRDVSLLIVIA